MPCKLNHNLICLGPGPSFKRPWDQFKPLTNKNARFHWILLFGPLSKVALSDDALLSQALNVFLLALCNNVCPYLGWIVVHIIWLHKKMPVEIDDFRPNLAGAAHIWPQGAKN